MPRSHLGANFKLLTPKMCETFVTIIIRSSYKHSRNLVELGHTYIYAVNAFIEAVIFLL